LIIEKGMKGMWKVAQRKKEPEKKKRDRKGKAKKDREKKKRRSANQQRSGAGAEEGGAWCDLQRRHKKTPEN